MKALLLSFLLFGAYELLAQERADSLSGQLHIQGNMAPTLRHACAEALSHFPELTSSNVEWRVRKKYTPLATRPSFASFFKAKNKRKYIITISSASIDTLKPLLFSNLTPEQRVGIMGHELSHAVDFQSKNFLQSIATAVRHLSPAFVDRMEYNTDLICIQHGLGNELKAYSAHVRAAMHVKNWRGVDYVFRNDQKHERYMNPETIEEKMRR